MNKNIQHITDKALCTGCGGCIGVCPANAIISFYNKAGFATVSIDHEKCTGCGICYDICPSNKSNTPNLNNCDTFHGFYLAGFIGHATVPEIRQKSQSGGAVTALLCFALEKGYIEGAVVNHLNRRIKRPEPVLATTAAEIIAGQGSYYTQSFVVKSILEQQNCQLAAVTLGCQAEALENIRNKFPKYKLPAYNFGLICSGQHSGFYIDELLLKAGCSESEITGFRFKDKDAGGWPGDVQVYTSEGTQIVNKNFRLLLKPVYELFRCRLCYNQMNIFSDIVFGDPWGVPRQDNIKGNTVLIARTEKGLDLIEDAKRTGVVELDDLPVTDIMRGQTVDGRLKTQFYTSMAICNEENFEVPYDSGIFKNVSYTSVSKAKYRELSKRIHYSRALFLEQDEFIAKELIAKKKSRVYRKAIFKNIINKLKIAVKFILRKLHLI